MTTSTPTEETTTPDEVGIISDDPYRVFLPGLDREVGIEKLRTRQLFKFLKILTVGAGPALAELSISADTDPAELTQQLLMVLLISVPEAEDEVIAFIHSMLRPDGLIDPERSSNDRKANIEKYTELYTDLVNPLPQDSMAILVQVVKNEAPNLVALGKQIAALIPTVSSAATSKSSSKKSSGTSTRSAS